jgi:hypothetical protein
MFSDPYLSRKVIRQPESNTVISENYHTPEFHKRIPRLSAVLAGQVLVAGDIFVTADEKQWMIMSFSIDSACVTECH